MFAEYAKNYIGERVLAAIVALAGDTYDRRKKMADKDLQTYEGIKAVYNRVLVGSRA